MSIFTLVYRSAPIFVCSLADYLVQVDDILSTSRRHNSEVSVTGALLFNEDWFVQYLEGAQDAVRAIFARIEADSRHEGVKILFEGFTTERRFPEWSMAFVGDAAEMRKRFAESPLADRDVKMHGLEVVSYVMALLDDAS